jgi:protein SCO1/2
MRPLFTGLVVVAILTAACGSDGGDDLTGMVRDPLPDVSSVVLPDAATGTQFTMSPVNADLLVVYFGYTSCPDVCPTTLADLRTAVRGLGDEADRIDVAMATVDPGRDDAARLTDYIQSFFPGGHGLRTDDPEELAEAADAFGVSYDVFENADGEVEVEHSAFLYAVDGDGLIRVQWAFGTSADDLESDLALLLAGAE